MRSIGGEGQFNQIQGICVAHNRLYCVDAVVHKEIGTYGEVVSHTGGRLHMLSHDGEALHTIAIQDDSFPTNVAAAADRVFVLCALFDDRGPLANHEHGFHALHVFVLLLFHACYIMLATYPRILRHFGDTHFTYVRIRKLIHVTYVRIE